MSKAIDFKKAIAKGEKNESEKEKEIYAESDESRKQYPLSFDPDTASIDELTSLISYTVAKRTADRFVYMAGDMDDASPRSILSIIEEMPSKEAVKLMRAVFITYGMVYATEDLELLDICAEFSNDVYDFFTDFFLQSDEIEPYLVANWLDEPDGCIVLKMPGGEHDKNYCHM